VDIIFSIDGLPELAKRLDGIAQIVAGPIAKEALEAGGEVIARQAEANIHSVTGQLASDVVVVTRARVEGGERYVLIGPGFNPESFRRSVQRRGKYASEAPAADQTTNPGVYGLFAEIGHGPPGVHRERQRAKRNGKDIEFGNAETPPHPWLGPAFETTVGEAVQVVADTIRERLESLNL
jgi:HK97 gp10 family phage protein